MNKIELTAAEIQVIEKQINGEIEIFTATDEEKARIEELLKEGVFVS